MRICSLASGSSGNCIYVGTDATHILVDVGLSGKRTQEGLNQLGLTLSDIDAILVTHEHADHVGGLGVLSRKYSIPIFCTDGTKRGALSMSSLGRIDQELFSTISQEERFRIKDLDIESFRISHDAMMPCAFRFFHGEKKAAIATDLGVYDDYTVSKLEGMDAIFLEANHDVRMLEVGPYPYPLKMRILGDRGHLSNENSGRLLARVLHDGVKAVTLGHLSHENNLPDLAYETVRLEITNADNPYKADDFRICVAPRFEKSNIMEI